MRLPRKRHWADRTLVPSISSGNSADALRADHRDLDCTPDDPWHRPPAVDDMWAEVQLLTRELAERIWFREVDYAVFLPHGDQIAQTEWIRERIAALNRAIARRKRAAA